MYYVKVEGQTLKDLKKGLERHLAEINGYDGSNVHISHSKANKETAKQLEELNAQEEMEEVKSPFKEFETTVPANVNTSVELELDSSGIPWDKRIHSSSKSKYKNDGTWKLARGVSDEDAAPVLAELRRAYGARVSSNTFIVKVPEEVFQAPPSTVVTPAQPVVQAAPIIPMPSMNINGGHSVDTFVSNFPVVIASLITEGKIGQDYVNSLCAHYGVTQIHTISDAQKAEIFNLFVDYKLIQKVG